MVWHFMHLGRWKEWCLNGSCIYKVELKSKRWRCSWSVACSFLSMRTTFKTKRGYCCAFPMVNPIRRCIWNKQTDCSSTRDIPVGYKDFKMNWTAVDFWKKRSALKIPVGIPYNDVLLLRSARNFMYPNQISCYSNCSPRQWRITRLIGVTLYVLCPVS